MKCIVLWATLAMCLICACQNHSNTLEFAIGSESVMVEREQAAIIIGADAAGSSLLLITLQDGIAARLHSVVSRHVGDSMSLRIGDIFELKNIPINEAFIPKTLHVAISSKQEAQRIVAMWGHGKL